MSRKRRKYDMPIWQGSMQKITYNGTVRELAKSSADMKRMTFERYRDSVDSEQFNNIWKMASELSRKVASGGQGSKASMYPVTRILINDYFERGENSLLSSYASDFNKEIENAEWRKSYRQEITAHRYEALVDMFGNEQLYINDRLGLMSFRDYFEMFKNDKLSYYDWSLLLTMLKTMYGEKFIHSKESS